MYLKKILSFRYKDINQLTGGWTLAHFAAQSGNISLLKDLKNMDKKWLKQSNNTGLTPAHIAAANGHLNVLHYLQYAGVDLHVEDKNGMPPFNFAQYYKHKDCMHFLLSNPPICIIS